MPYMVELLYQWQQILMFEHEWESKMSAGTYPPWCFQVPAYVCQTHIAYRWVIVTE